MVDYLPTIIGGVMTILGSLISVQPPDPKYHRKLFVVFTVLGVLAMGTGIWTQYRGQKAAADRDERDIKYREKNDHLQAERDKEIASLRGMMDGLAVALPGLAGKADNAAAVIDAQRRYAELRDRLAAVETHQRERLLDQEQHNYMVKSLALYGHQEVDLSTSVGCDDCQKFGKALVAVFSELDWLKDNMVSYSFYPDNGEGVIVATNGPSEMADRLVQILHDEFNFDAQRIIDNKYPDKTTVWVYVNRKP